MQYIINFKNFNLEDFDIKQYIGKKFNATIGTSTIEAYNWKLKKKHFKSKFFIQYTTNLKRVPTRHFVIPSRLYPTQKKHYKFLTWTYFQCPNYNGANEVWRVTNLQVLDMNLSHDVGQSPPLFDYLVPTRFYQPLNLSKGEGGGGK